jgi:acylphosphatase
MDELVRITVRGIVQGVGFRAFTEHAARRLGVAGWVRNLPGGDVEVLARLPPGNKQAFLAQLQRGPVGSRVAQVDVQPAAAGADVPRAGFTIRH